MATSRGTTLVARGADWRFPEFWCLWAGLLGLLEWSVIYAELSEAHVNNVGLILFGTAALSLIAIAAPKQVRRTSVSVFAGVLLGGLVVLVASWRHFGIEMSDAGSIKRAFTHDTRHPWEWHFDEGLSAYFRVWWMILAGGVAALLSVVVLGYFARPTGAPTKRAKAGIYGESDWMSLKDAKALFPASGEIVIGEAYRVDQDVAAQAPFDKSDASTWGQGGRAPLLCMDVTDEKTFASSHGLFFAGSGGFKTVSAVIPTCLKWRGGMVVLDPSCEILSMVRNYREDVLKKQVIALDPKNPVEGFNVLDWIDGSARKEQNIVTVASWLMPERPDVVDSAGQVFGGQARNLIAGLIGYVLLEKPERGAERSLREVRKILSHPKGAFSEKLREIHDRSTSRYVRETIGQFVDMTEVTLSGIHFNASEATAWLSIDNLAKLVCEGDQKTSDIVSGRYDVFINIDMRTMIDNPGVARLLIGALSNTVLEAEGDIPGRLLFLLDEAFTLGYMKILEVIRDGMRKYRITLILIYQSIGKLKEAFGRHAQQSWFDSVSFVSFAAVGDPETARLISEEAGKFTAETSSRSTQWGFLGSASIRQGETRSLHARPLIMPEEVLRQLHGDEQIVLVKGRPALRCGRAIYFRRPEMTAVVGQNKFARVA